MGWGGEERQKNPPSLTYAVLQEKIKDSTKIIRKVKSKKDKGCKQWEEGLWKDIYKVTRRNKNVLHTCKRTS